MIRRTWKWVVAFAPVGSPRIRRKPISRPSSLKRIAEILDAPITYFYSVSDQPASKTADILGFVDNARTLRLIRAYSRIENPQLQQALLELTERIAGEPSSPNGKG